ncbi:hypothetical protein RDI58_004286 [Solanum bulbocastanum]|uniref:Uncharacterized protein n=1 Tax=Solanum bulbocastanum TaxID=147425 RepID=A0AAN8YL62_SOLBU
MINISVHSPKIMSCDKPITELSKSDDVMHNNSSPMLVQKYPQAQADLNNDLLVEKTSDKDAQGEIFRVYRY